MSASQDTGLLIGMFLEYMLAVSTCCRGAKDQRCKRAQKSEGSCSNGGTSRPEIHMQNIRLDTEVSLVVIP